MSIHYHQSPQSAVAPYIAQRILTQLQSEKRVLWLLSGGSGGRLCIEASKLLAGHDLSGLFVTMSDERYGPLGHTNENMQQLIDGGLTLPKASVYRPISGAVRSKTTADFNAWLHKAEAETDYTIATLGIGEDGHTSGIKPHSPATTSTQWAVDFDGDDFERITTTTTYLRTFNEAIVQLYGTSKHQRLYQLLSGEGESEDLPMLDIASIPYVTIFSDAPPMTNS